MRISPGHIIAVSVFLAGISNAGIGYSQGFYNSGATISVTTGTILSIPDSMVNKGILINNGEIIISGAWINTGTYEPATGEINFDSDLDQAINHNAQSIEKLVISGGGHKEFLANITVQSELRLEAGILVAKNGARIIMDKNATLVGGSDGSHINGPVERQGASQWDFPVGNGVKYLPVSVSNITNASSFGILTVHELSANEILTGTIDLERYSTQRYFELVVGGGDLQAGSKITLPVVDEDDLNVDNNLVTIASSQTAMTSYSDIGQGAFTGNLSQGTITSKGGATTKYYALAAVRDDRTIEVFNALSPGNDGKNDYLTIRNIELYPNNHVVIHNRWGDKVFDMTSYDNSQNVFKGLSDNGNKLPAGTYFYTIDLSDGTKKHTGFIVIK